MKKFPMFCLAVLACCTVAYFHPSPYAPIISYGFVMGSGATLMAQWCLTTS